MAIDTKKGVPGIPLAALDAISDENTRLVLRAIVDGWHVRNGASGSGDSAFITKSELGGLKTGGWFGGNAQSPQSERVQIKPSDINRIINDLQAQVMESLLFKELGERVALIDKPGGIFDRVGETELVLRNEVTQRIESGEAFSYSISVLGTRVGASEAALVTEVTQRVNAENAIQQAITTQYAAVNQSMALIQQANTTAANTVSALSQSMTQVQAQVGDNAVAVQQETTARVNANNDLYAKISVKIDMNGYVSGYGLMSTANNSTPFSEFIVRADRFAIGSPTGPGITPRVPFIVTTTPDSNGNPPGVYMDMAVMKNASIGSALIGNAQIKTAHIEDLSVNTLKIRENSVSYVTYLQVSQSWISVHGPSSLFLVGKCSLETNSNCTVTLSVNGAGLDYAAAGGGGASILVPAACSGIYYVPRGVTGVHVSITAAGSFTQFVYPTISVIEVLR